MTGKEAGLSTESTFPDSTTVKNLYNYNLLSFLEKSNYIFVFRFLQNLYFLPVGHVSLYTI